MNITTWPGRVPYSMFLPSKLYSKYTVRTVQLTSCAAVRCAINQVRVPNYQTSNYLWSLAHLLHIDIALILRLLGCEGRLWQIAPSLRPSTSSAAKICLTFGRVLQTYWRMSGLRNRRLVDRDAEATDLFSSSMIFGNAGAGVSATSHCIQKCFWWRISYAGAAWSICGV